MLKGFVLRAVAMGVVSLGCFDHLAFGDLIVTDTWATGYVDAADIKAFREGSPTNYRFGSDPSGNVTKAGVLFDEQGHYSNGDLAQDATLLFTTYGILDSPLTIPVERLGADLSISSHVIDKTNTTSNIIALSGGWLRVDFDVNKTQYYEVGYSVSRYGYQMGYSVPPNINDARIAISLYDSTGLAGFSQSLDSAGLHGDEMASMLSKVQLLAGHSYTLEASFTCFSALGFEYVSNAGPGASRSSGASAQFHLTALPEPGSVVMLGIGAAVVGGFRRRRK